MSGPEGSYISGVAGSPVDIGRQGVGSSNIAKPMFEEVLQRVEFYLGHTVCGGAKTPWSPVF
jgi:hypothetical protein